MTNEAFKKQLEERTLVLTTTILNFLYQPPKHPRVPIG